MLPELETLTPPSPQGSPFYMTYPVDTYDKYSMEYSKSASPNGPSGLSGLHTSNNAAGVTPAQQAVQKAAGHPAIQGTEPIPTKSLQIRTDKPRPHVCLTCTRSFARLEHLKRHERSHTKERPFQCPICERCFARRDLLLRHRQKLHANFPESPKSKTVRRRSSVAQTPQTPASVPPQDPQLAQQQQQHPVQASQQAPLRQQSVTQVSHMQKMPEHQPKKTYEDPTFLNPFNLDLPSFTNPFDKASDLLMHPENHRDNDRELRGRRTRPASFSASCSASYLRDADIEMLKDKFPIDDHVQVEFSTPQLAPATLSHPDYCIDEVLLSQGQSSFVNPRLLNHDSPEEPHVKHEPLMSMFDELAPASMNEDFDWMSQYVDGVGSEVLPAPQLPTSFAPAEMILTPPNSIHTQNNNMQQHQHYQHTQTMQGQPPHTINSTEDVHSFLNSLDPQAPADNVFLTENKFQQHTPPAYHGPTFTPQIRLQILNILATPTPYQTAFKLPNTADLQRYVVAFQDHFSKHLPFLHSTLEFNNENIPLALCMAAIGARYLFEFDVAQSIFEVSRCCVHTYLEGKREKKAQQGSGTDTPVWLIQALTLGVVYGLFSDDALVNDIAVAQASAVVSLARAAGLHLPAHNFFALPGKESSVTEKWQYFINVQTRIRTLHAIHALSCLVATGYNVCTSLKNSDIVCGSPCDESLWSSNCATEWWDIVKRKELDGSLKTTVGGPSYGNCLTQLIQGHTLVDKIPQFTLLSLMYGALLEISERRKVFNRNWHGAPEEKQRAWLNLQKKPIESFLRTWETTWSMSPLASLSPNSQYGPLMSDAIPLSSLAHVRTYVDLQPVKEAFAKKNFERMGHELSTLDDGMSADFHGLLEAASYSADSISLWEKHSVRWTMETLVSQTFIHALMAIFDCGLVVSEFFRRLEQKPKTMWTDAEAQLWIRMSKILYRVCESVKDKDRSIDLSILSIESLPTPEVSNPKQRLSLLTLHVVSKMLTSVYVWPYMKTMAEALRHRARQIR